METFKLTVHTDEHGVVKFELTTPLPNQDIEVVVHLQPLQTPELDAMGYPIGYFEQTYGMFADNPIERGEQPPLETRDEIE